ncbi:MAG: hypothetical protein AAGJ11_09905 [Bacteroidota bacterium]
MESTPPVLHVLLIEDDPDNLELLVETLETEIAGHSLRWDPCDDFDEALERIERQRYDLVVTDVYRDRQGEPKTVEQGDVQAGRVVDQIVNRRFCPVVVFTDGSIPSSVTYGPFVRSADKSMGNGQIETALRELIETGIPAAARAIHEEIDQVAGSYLWSFLSENWDDLRESGLDTRSVLERVLRRRAAIQLARIRGGAAPEEVGVVEAAEFYVYPSIAGDEYRLGEVVRGVDDGAFRVVLTPHCHLTVQSGKDRPKTEFVLTVRAVPAGEAVRLAYEGSTEDPWSGSAAKVEGKVRRRINSPADLMGSPAGRYWFLPGFLKIPDLYCDLLQLESLPFEVLRDDYDRVAVLDTPFAEALQSCFTRFYSSVGLPALDPARFDHLPGLTANGEPPIPNDGASAPDGGT